MHTVSRRGGTCAILLVVLAGLSQVTRAAEAAKGLFGDWGGARSWLSDQGIDLEASYTNEFAQAVRGAPEDTADADQWYLGGSFDLQRIASVPGASIFFSFTDRNGTSLSLKPGLETLMEVQEIYGEGNYTRLNQLYWEQKLFRNEVTLKLGRLTGTFDFMAFSCNFQNIAFCATLPSHNVVPNWVAFPGGTWAGVVRFAPRPEWYVQAGVYEVNPALQQHGARFVLGEPFGGPGQRFNAEFGWLPAGGGEGNGFRLGAWYDNVGGNDLYWNNAGQPLATHGGTPLQHHQQSGFYAMAQQRIWSSGLSDSRGISVFMNFLQADRQISVKDEVAEIGLFWTGPLNARPQDELGAAFGRVHVSSRVSAGERLYDAQVAAPNDQLLQPVETSEFPLEIYYGISLTPGLTLRPNVQFIRSPHGVSDSPTLVVFGLHFSVLF